jgi:hypothetical protein
MDARPPTNVRVVPDLGGELLLALERLEALLLSLATWEAEADDVGLPPPFENGKALRALQAVGDVVRPTQARGGAQLVSGRLPRRGWTGRMVPLRFVPIADASLATLEHAAQVLAVQRAYPSLSAAIERYTQVLGEERVAVVKALSRVVSVLTLPWDDDMATLWDAVTAYPDKCDVELSRTEQHAYDMVVGRIDRLWPPRTPHRPTAAGPGDPPSSGSHRRGRGRTARTP